MRFRVVEHLRSNAIAYLALGVGLLGLGSGAYAAVVLPANSVGARQIRKGSITPAKFNHAAIGGTILHWAQVDAPGDIVSGSRGAHESFPLNDNASYGITWGDTVPHRCTVIATVLGSFIPSEGFISAIKESIKDHTTVLVNTFGIDGARTPQPFSVAVIC